MAKKKEVKEELGVFNFIEFNKDIIEDGSKTPSVLIDNYVGVCIDELNYELVRIKQVTVTEDNIKTATNLYGNKYKLGDTYQEWISMKRYLGDFVEAAETYSKMKFKEEVSKLKYCSDISVLNKIRQDIHDNLQAFMKTDTVPKIAFELNSSCKDLQSVKAEIKSTKEYCENAKKEIDKYLADVKESRKIIVDFDKPKKYKVKLEED